MRAHQGRECDTFPGFHKTRVKSREHSRNCEHTNDATQPVIRVRKPSNNESDTDFDTITVITTPEEPDNKSSSQRMPYVGRSPSEIRKVSVQVSTEDYDTTDGQSLTVNEPLKLYSPQLVRSHAPTALNGLVVAASTSHLTPLTLLTPYAP